MENSEKCHEMFLKKRKHDQILLKSQLSARECWKCKIVLQIIWKRYPAQSEQA